MRKYLILLLIPILSDGTMKPEIEEGKELIPFHCKPGRRWDCQFHSFVNCYGMVSESGLYLVETNVQVNSGGNVAVFEPTTRFYNAKGELIYTTSGGTVWIPGTGRDPGYKASFYNNSPDPFLKNRAKECHYFDIVCNGGVRKKDDKDFFEEFEEKAVDAIEFSDEWLTRGEEFCKKHPYACN